ncbi:MAG TPA: hypothetical protein VFV99_31430 [Kofleriaceae bacterium]|nr:hypothetical protein [Kofleriaceae bacterium]
MTRSLLLSAFIGLLATGCVVLPTTKTTVKNAGTEKSPLTYGRVKAVSLQTGSSRTDVRVRVLSTRECSRQILAVKEITKSKHARLGVDDPRGRAVGIVLSPVTMPISAIITGIIVASSDDETTRVTKPLRIETTECHTDAAEYPLELEFPTGHIYRGKTDKNGVLALAIPRDEPYVGQVAVRSTQATAELHYEQTLPPVTATRDAIESCRTENNVDGVTAKLTIDTRGFATRLWLSAGDAKLHACVATKIAGVVFPAALHNATVVLPST